MLVTQTTVNDMTAQITNFDPERCAQRNRLAARRDGINSAPVRVLSAAPGLADGQTVTVSKGNIPTSDDKVLERINALLPSGANSLTADKIYVHYLEAANSNYIGDRFMFLEDSSLKNVATAANAGFAFMNSHRKGGMSHPSELPFGRTFAGKYEESTDAKGRPFQRSLVGFYMLAGTLPNGTSGPSTDTLHAMIEGGTLFDCSVGLYGGIELCDICGEDLSEFDDKTGEYLCPHMPGTTHDMTAAQIKTQKERGVPDGLASYTLRDATCSEVSGVYDGAVPGAGFRKGLQLSKKNALTAEELAQARQSYAPLLGKNDFMEDNNGILQLAKDMLETTLQSFGLHKQVKESGEQRAQTALEAGQAVALGVDADGNISAVPLPTTVTTLPGDPEPGEQTNTAQPAEQLGAAAGENEIMAGRIELATAFNKLGANKLAGAVAAANDDNPDTIALSISNHVSAEVADSGKTGSARSAQEQDIVSLANGADITNADQMRETLKLAKLGTAYGVEVRAEAKKQANRAYNNGSATGSALAKQCEEQCDILPVEAVKSMSNTWQAQADATHGYGKNGAAPDRASSAAGERPDSTPANVDQGKELSPQEKDAAFEKRRRELLSTTEVGRATLAAEAAGGA